MFLNVLTSFSEVGQSVIWLRIVGTAQSKHVSHQTLRIYGTGPKNLRRRLSGHSSVSFKLPGHVASRLLQKGL